MKIMSILLIPQRNKIHTSKFFYLLLLHLCFYFLTYLNTQMINTFSLERISKTDNFDSNLIVGQYKLDLTARFKEMKSINPK